MSNPVSILRHAARRLFRSPGYATGLILTLALGIGVSVVAFSVLNGVVLRSLPYPDQDRVVRIESANPLQNVANGNLTPAQAQTFARESERFDALGYFMWGGVTVMHQDRPLEITSNRVSAEYFRALGVRAHLGRLIDTTDIETGEPVAVLSHDSWQRLTGGSADIIGQTLQTSNGPVQVIGVMPRGFRFPSEDVGVWLGLDPRAMEPDKPVYWNARYIEAVGRLAPGVSRQAAVQELEVLDSGIRERYGIADTGWTVTMRTVLDELVGNVRWVLWSVFAVSLLVLLVACANVAALVGGRLAERRRQLAIAMAVGATRTRLRLELATELAIAALIAGVLGALIAYLAVDVVRVLAPEQMPRTDQIAVNFSVLAFAILVAVGVPFLVLGLGAAIGLPNASAAAETSRGALGSRRGRPWLPSLGIALSTTALIAAAALVLSLVRLSQVAPGYRTDGVQALQMFRGGGPDEWRRFAGEASKRMVALPGVSEVAVTTSAPQSLIGSFDVDLQVPGRALPEPLQAQLRRVDPGYLPLLDIPVIAGRNFAGTDHAEGPKVAIVNETLARRVFGDVDPVGRELALPLGSGPRVPVRVVGVARDIRNAGLRSLPEPEVLVPFDQFPWVGMTFMARAPADLAGIEEQMRSVIWELDPEEGITREFALGADVASQTRPLRFFSSSVGFFAGACLLLGALGVYSVLAFLQRRRVPELGVRLALGAAPSRLFRAVVGEGARIVAYGLAGGVLGAFALLRLMESQLYAVGALPWLAMIAGGLLMTVTALAAALLPALRAARINPVESLRCE